MLKDTGVSDFAKDLIGYVIGDKLSVKRAMNLSKIITNANVDNNGVALLNDKYKVNFINNASLEDDADMQELWSNLLYNAVANKDSNVTYLNILKELDVVSAKIFNKIYSTEAHKMPELSPLDFYEFGCNNNNIVSKFDNLGRLGLVRIISINGIKPSMPGAMQLIKEHNTYLKYNPVTTAPSWMQLIKESSTCYFNTDLGFAMYKHLNRLPIQ